MSAFNDYVRKALKYGDDKIYTPMIPLWMTWNYQHQPPNFFRPLRQANVMADLAWAMKYNPNLKIQLNAGYFDLATPFYEGIYEMRQLPMPAKLQDNIEYKFYQSGHMVYVNLPSLQLLHDNVAKLIRATSNPATRSVSCSVLTCGDFPGARRVINSS